MRMVAGVADGLARCRPPHGAGRFAGAAGVVVIALCVGPAPASAQILEHYLPTNLLGYDVNPGVTVLSRLRPLYDTPGVRVGDVMVRPQVSESFGYDSKPVPGQRGGSSLLVTDGSVLAETQWSRHRIGLLASVYDVQYLNLPRQSYTNWTVGISGGYDIGRGTISAGYTHYNLNQLPTGIDNVGIQQPQPYHTDEVRVGYKGSDGPWTFIPAFIAAATRFSTVTNPDGSVQTGANLDRNLQTASLETHYDIAAQRSLVFVVRNTSAQYLGGQPKRNYNDFAVLTGLDSGPEGVFRYRGLVGYEFRNYENAAYKSHSAPIVEASVIWSASGLTTVTGSAIYRIEDANEDAYVGYQYTQARLAVDHEYLRNVLLHGHVSVQNANYFQSPTQQTLYNVGGGITWLINRNMRLTASYDFSDVRQNTAPGNYIRNVALLRIRFGL